MRPRARKHEIIQEYGKKYAALRAEIAQRLAELSPAELGKLAAASRTYGEANCYWTEYRAIHEMISPEIAIRQRIQTEALEATGATA